MKAELQRARRWVRHRLAKARRRRSNPSAEELPKEPPRHRRYRSAGPERSEALLQAARTYVSSRSEGDRAWLYRKPYDANPGHPAFFEEMYGAMNLLRAMDIPPGGRVVEVGSGPGWLTEILLALGYEVDSLDPSEDMIAIARERIGHARRHHHLGEAPRAGFHTEALESCSLPAEEFDAVLLHAALHHVIDEEQGLAQCFRLLRPGGVLGVNEAAWIPGDPILEEKLDEEMRQSGTLESPYTVDYLDFLLRKLGFVDVRRYFTVNGLFPEEQGGERLSDVAVSHPWDSNNLTARKPSPYAATTLDRDARTSAAIKILESHFEPATGVVHLKARLTNQGKTAWLAAAPRVGWVSIALRRGELGASNHEEAEPRHRLPQTLAPGEALTLDLAYRLPPALSEAPWILDLVNEGIFWFSERGTRPALLPDQRSADPAVYRP